MAEGPTAVVTGASSGIGAATARQLAKAGYQVVLGARRVDRVRRLAEDIGPSARALPLAVTAMDSVRAFCQAVPECQLLVNNAGGALGLDPIAQADDEQWRTMFETNVLGSMRMIRALLPKLEASGDGFVINVGSIAGFESYVGGAGYNAAKFGERALSEVLRLELLGKPVRVSEVAPGMVETEFSTVRFGGDSERAARVYTGMTPLSADDVADVIVFVATRPPHVDVDYVVIRPRDQARAGLVHRRQ